MDTGTTAFMLCCIIGLTMMIPGLALFYGGMVSVKSSVNMMMMTYGAVAVVGVLWFVVGFSIVFGNSVGGLFGNPTEFLGSSGLFSPDGSTDQTSYNGLSLLLFSLFQALFACITVALISGAAADRMKFGAWMVFAGAWAVAVYFPVAHWVFSFDGVVSEHGGWIANSLGALDFAGGTAVHINAGAAALALAIVLGKSRSFGTGPKPHNVPLTMLGAGLLWAGWYAFNGGSWLGASDGAAFAMVTTFLATCAATLAWLGVEKLRDGHVSGIGAAAGAITGLVAITPACGDVTPMGGILVGLVAGAICPMAIGLKERFGYDDSLDVVGVHLVGGIIGTLMIGIVGSSESVQGVAGLLYGGGLDQFWKQLTASAAVLIYSFGVSCVLALALKATMGLRITPEDEELGIDAKLHRDRAYELV